MQPARLRFATTEFDFGVRDMREPLIIDRDLVVMAAEGLDGTPIATLVQWACHPEAVLNYGSEQYGLDPASMTETEREPWGRVMSAGFPGYFAREMKRLRGGVPLYFNGPLGGMITNLDGVLWDPDAHPEFPTTADPSTVPEQIRIPNDFRYAAVQGRELARAAAVALEASGKTAVETTVDYSRAEFLMPLENPLFRAGAALGFMGYYPRHLYDERGRRDMRTAPWVGGLLVPALDVPQGKFLRSEVSVVRIGPAQIANVPTEALPEFTVGLPPDFATDTVKYFPQNAGAHATGEAYRMIHPALKDQMDAEFKMVFCLSGDDLGYLIPEADFRPSHDIPIPPLSWWWVTSDAVADPHYEESMTVSSRIEPAIMGALTTLLSGKDTGP